MASTFGRVPAETAGAPDRLMCTTHTRQANKRLEELAAARAASGAAEASPALGAAKPTAAAAASASGSSSLDQAMSILGVSSAGTSSGPAPGTKLSGRQALMAWSRQAADGYPLAGGIEDFSNSWTDGMALCAVVHRYRPDLLPWSKVKACASNVERIQLAFDAARTHGIRPLIDADDLAAGGDEFSMITYLTEVYHQFSALPRGDGYTTA